MRSAILKKAQRLWRNAGPAALVKHSANATFETVQTYSSVLSVRNRQFTDLEKLLDFAYSTGGGSTSGSITPLQVRSEISQLLLLVAEARPKTTLEIGTANGGSLFLFTRTAAPDAHLISVDLPGGEFGDGYPIWRIPLYHSFAQPGQQIDLVRADSHSALTRQKIEQMLGGAKLDFIFLDGDHTYDGVKSDFQMYSSLVRSGGLIAFHDITEFNYGAADFIPERPFGVKRFWDEVKIHFEHFEFIENPKRNYGIGVLLTR
ncbi:MAG: O-methyltransferase [Bryobacteraceae bacterium]